MVLGTEKMNRNIVYLYTDTITQEKIKSRDMFFDFYTKNDTSV